MTGLPGTLIITERSFFIQVKNGKTLYRKYFKLITLQRSHNIMDLMLQLRKALLAKTLKGHLSSSSFMCTEIHHVQTHLLASSMEETRQSLISEVKLSTMTCS